MTKGDKIYCYTCGKISYDTAPPPSFVNPNTKPSGSRQDSRFNPHWNYRCGHCHGFKTINASQFLEEDKEIITIKLLTSNNRETLKARGRELKELGILKNFRVRETKKNTFTLYEVRRVKREILRALEIVTKKKTLNSMKNII